MADATGDKELYMRMLRRMMTIRRFDETVQELVQSAELVGMAHVYIGRGSGGGGRVRRAA